MSSRWGRGCVVGDVKRCEWLGRRGSQAAHSPQVVHPPDVVPLVRATNLIKAITLQTAQGRTTSTLSFTVPFRIPPFHLTRVIAFLSSSLSPSPSFRFLSLSSEPFYRSPLRPPMPPDPASPPAVDVQPSSRPSQPPFSRASLIRRYKWDILTPAERTAVSDALGLAATRASVGVAAVLTTTAIITTGTSLLSPFVSPLLHSAERF